MSLDVYALWIRANVVGDGYGKCHEIASMMSGAFPELSVRKGRFHSLFWGARAHWWLRTPDGAIVDPTGRQHPDGQHFPPNADAYEDLTDLTDEELAHRLPSGVCANCGGDTYEGDFVCSDACGNAFATSLTRRA